MVNSSANNNNETILTEIASAFKDVSFFCSDSDDSESDYSLISESRIKSKSELSYELKNESILYFKNGENNLNLNPSGENGLDLILENLGDIVVNTSLDIYTMTKDCLLFEPKDLDIVKNDLRYIYLNTVLSESEQISLAKLRHYANYYNKRYPHVIWEQALRFLYSLQFHITKTIEIMDANLKFRIEELPIHESDVIDDLKNGIIYWHGRDINFRPILIVNLKKLDVIKDDLQRIQNLICFCLEFFLRYLQIAGRIENWNVIMDFQDKGITELPIQALRSVLTMINTRYRMRLNRMFIVNSPYIINMVSSAVFSTFPLTSMEKIKFVSTNYDKELLDLIPNNQLEVRYGGEITNIEDNFYPFRFYPLNSNGEIPTEEIPLEFIAGITFEIPPKYEVEKLPWIKYISKLNLTHKAAAYLSQVLKTHVASYNK